MYTHIDIDDHWPKVQLLCAVREKVLQLKLAVLAIVRILQMLCSGQERVMQFLVGWRFLKCYTLTASTATEGSCL